MGELWYVGPPGNDARAGRACETLRTDPCEGAYVVDVL